MCVLSRCISIGNYTITTITKLPMNAGNYIRTIKNVNVATIFLGGVATINRYEFLTMANCV